MKQVKNTAMPLLLLASVLATPSISAPRIVIALQPLGSIDDRLVATAARGIENLYTGLMIGILERSVMPAEAYYKKNKRYRAEILLRYLERKTDVKYVKVIGLTDRDISTTKGNIHDWGIFGLASVDGRACVVSTFRLRSGGVTDAAFIERFVKVVNHELGHTFGLDHCPTPGCVMEDARGTIKTVDRETGRFCPRCRKFLRERGVDVRGR